VSEEGKVVGKLTVGSVQQREHESRGEGLADGGTAIGLCGLRVTWDTAV
jgi:hypothetical protein